MVIKKALNDNKSKVYGGAWSVHDDELVKARNYFLSEFSEINLTDKNVLQDIKKKFFNVYKTWLFSDFDFAGTNLYSEYCYTQGTTESFAQFYLRYGRTHRLRLAKGEYFYHQMMKNLEHVKDFCWLEDDDIKSGDCLLISVPFSDTGDVPQNLESILCDCDNLEVPVMLDMAYINLTNKNALTQTIDLTHDCIEYVVSSLSKAFPIEHYRVGIRMQKTKFEDQLYVINEDNYNYLNFCSMYIGLKLMEKFPAKYMFDKYRTDQLELCRILGVEPSPCYIFGVDKKNRYSQYSRGRDSNRLCFSRIWDGRVTQENFKE